MQPATALSANPIEEVATENAASYPEIEEFDEPTPDAPMTPSAEATPVAAAPTTSPTVSLLALRATRKVAAYRPKPPMQIQPPKAGCIETDAVLLTPDELEQRRNQAKTNRALNTTATLPLFSLPA